MKVKFDGPRPEYHPATGLELVPGTFEVDDDKGAQLVAAGLVKEVPEAVDSEPPAQDAAPAAANARKGRG